MAEIIDGEFIRNETNMNSMGGTERLTEELAKRLGPELKGFQIVSSRVRELHDDKIRVFWAHDLPGDPESAFLKDKNEMDKFHKYVFVSNWQMQAYINQYGIPWSKCIVLRNAIDPIEPHEKPDHKEQLRFVYHSTPHRGLNILTAVWQKLTEKYGDKIHLDVFSSFKLYGWEERDKQYDAVFQILDSMPNVTNHGTQPNEVVREALKQSHVFAYPSIWPETSCMCLMEAMSAGLVCVHSNYGALYETAGNWNQMYQMHEDNQQHAGNLYTILEATIENYEAIASRTASSSAYANIFYSWDHRVQEWQALLQLLRRLVTDTSMPEAKFSYSTTA